MSSVRTNLSYRTRIRFSLPPLVTTHFTLQVAGMEHSLASWVTTDQTRQVPMEVEVNRDRSCSTTVSGKGYKMSVRNLCYAPEECGTLVRTLHSATTRCLSLVSCLGFRALPASPNSIYSNQVYETHQEDVECAGVAPHRVVKRRDILKNVSFHALSGEVTAIAGPSGAGKSTLLSVMAGELRPSGGCHSLLVNGSPVGAAHMRRISGYVKQDHDALFPFLTVYETLLYSARLRLPATVSWLGKLARVEEVMKELGLTHVAHSLIGDPSDMLRHSSGSRQQHISGGQRRRTSIGVQSIHDPAILFLDEPTSGLDSGAAFQVVDLLQAAAAANSRTVVLSVHQPSVLILRQLSKIVLLADGQVTHDGSLHGLATRLQAAGHCIPPEMSALEYVMHHEGLVLPVDGQRIVQPGAPVHVTHPQDIPSCPQYANGRLLETCILASRFYKTTFRSTSLASTIFLQVLMTSFGLGLLYSHTDRHLGERGIHQRNGFLAYSLTFLITSAATHGLPVFLQDRMILTREASRGAYRVSSYVLSNSAVLVAFLLPVAIVFAIPAYFMLGLSSDFGTFIFFVLVIWVSLTMANSLSAFVTALVPSYIQGYSVTQSMIGVFFLFSGYFIAKHEIPKYMLFLSYFSLFKYPLEALLINEFSGLKDHCFAWSSETAWNSPPQNVSNLHCRVTAQDVLRQAGLQGQNKWTNLLVMAAFAVAYRILCTLVLTATILHG